MSDVQVFLQAHFDILNFGIALLLIGWFLILVAISWTEKFKLDVWYVDHCTLWTDIQVIFITVKNVLMRKDINFDGAAEMKAFDGTN